MRLPLFAALWLLTLPAHAGQWLVEPESSLRFTAHYQGEAFEGGFPFTANIVFDSGDLANARFEVEIDVARVDSDSEERDETLRAAEWFDVERYPQARFRTTGFRTAAAGGFEADAELMIRDRSKPLLFPFRFEVDGERATLDAKVMLNRMDFALGEGDWSDPELIAHPVEVRVKLLLKRRPPAP